MQLLDYLDRILEWHARLGSPVADSLQPGLSETEILTATGGLPFQVSREFIQLYRWRNGTRWHQSSASPSFFEYHRFLPLEEALSKFGMLHGIMKEYYEIADWVLTFQDAAGDGYGVLGCAESQEATPVAFLFEGEGVEIVFETLTAMMRTVAAWYEEGVMSMGHDGALDTDFVRMGQVAHRLNPNIHYWEQYVASCKSKRRGPSSAPWIQRIVRKLTRR
jgi:hypothetical protein